MYAVINSNFEATQILVSFGADYRLKTDTGSVLIMAVESNQ
jgi:hypothetical protein